MTKNDFEDLTDEKTKKPTNEMVKSNIEIFQMVSEFAAYNLMFYTIFIFLTLNM